MIDRETFKAIVGRYGADYVDGALNDGVIDNMLNIHVSNKKHIFKLFGNKLKIEVDVEIAISDEKIEKVQRTLLNELKNDKRLILAYSLIKTIGWNEFRKNTLCRDINFLNTTLSKGMKISKALMKLVLPEDQHRVATIYSMANQKLFTKGRVVLSIDPCDYVTMSSNSSGWRSCHRLDGGEFRTGPIAYLIDSSTVICYIESSTPCNFNYRGKGYTHTNKVWRQIALVSPDLKFAMQERQYPNSNSTNQLAVSNVFKELFENLHETKYKINEDVDNDLLCELHIDYATKKDVERLYYNDTLSEMYSYANVIAPLGTSLQELKRAELPIKGERAYCLSCGGLVEDSETLYCCDCGYDDDDDDDY